MHSEALDPESILQQSFGGSSYLGNGKAKMHYGLRLTPDIGFYRVNSRSTVKTALLVLLVSGTIAPFSPLGPVSAQETSPALVSVWSEAHGSPGIVDASLTPGTVFPIQIMVSDAPLFNGYEYFLYYDAAFLQVDSVDAVAGTVFNQPFIARQDISTPGTVRMTVVNLGTGFAGATGVLSHVRFRVLDIGESPFALAAGIDEPSAAAQSWTRLVLGDAAINTSTTDGYFSNQPTRQIPVASFKVHPSNPSQGNSIIFDATASHDPDHDLGANRGIARYVWDFGDGASINTVYPVTQHDFVQNPFANILTYFDGNFSVRLTVVSVDDAFQAMKVEKLTINHATPPDERFAVLFSPAEASMSPDNSLQIGVFIHSLNGFAGSVNINTSAAPLIPNGVTVSISQSIVEVAPGEDGKSVVSVSTTPNTLPGHYVVKVTGESEGRHVTSLALVTVTPLEPLLVRSKVSWEHRLSLSATGGVQNWTARVANLNPTINIEVKVRVTVIDRADNALFNVDSGFVTLRGGETNPAVLVTHTFADSDVGLRFDFIATITWRFFPENFLLESTSSKTGTFVIGP